MKTSNKLLLGFLIVALAGITALAVTAKLYIDKNTIAGNGKKTSETRQVQGFNKINAKGHFNIYLTQGTESQLKINADENLIPFIESTVANGELSIKLNGKISKGDNIEVYLTVDPTVNEMIFSAGVNVEGTSDLNGDKLNIQTSSGAQTQLKLKYNELYMDASSGGLVTLSGAANNAIFNFSSGGNISAEDFAVERAEASGSSGGNASINVSKELKVDVSSGANLDYSGNAMITSMKQSSGGNISKQ